MSELTIEGFGLDDSFDGRGLHRKDLRRTPVFPARSSLENVSAKDQLSTIVSLRIIS